MELLDLKTWTWTKKSAYPFEAKVNNAPAIHVGNDEFVLFGGQTCGSPNCFVNTIASYSTKTDKWTMLGRLKTPRSQAGFSVIPGGFLILGGTPDKKQKPSEKCLFNGDQLECTHQNPTGPSGKSNILKISSSFYY